MGLTEGEGLVPGSLVSSVLEGAAGEGLGVAGACNPVSSVSRLGEGASWVESPLETAGVESSSPWAAQDDRANRQDKIRQETLKFI